MARGRGTKPTHYIAVTARVGKGKYEKGPYIGLWEGEDRDGPLFRGSVQGKYADELFDFLKDHEDNVSFAIFESRGGGRGRGRRDGDGEEDEPPRGRRSSRGRDRDDRDSERGSRRSSSRGRGDRDEKEDRGGRDSRGSSRGGKDKGDWWED